MELDRIKEEISKLKEELDRTKRGYNTYVADLKREYEDMFNELELKNTSLWVELHNELDVNSTITQRIAMIENQCEYATTSAASCAFSKFSPSRV